MRHFDPQTKYQIDVLSDVHVYPYIHLIHNLSKIYYLFLRNKTHTYLLQVLNHIDQHLSIDSVYNVIQYKN